jgi:hypothetical protein
MFLSHSPSKVFLRLSNRQRAISWICSLSLAVSLIPCALAQGVKVRFAGDSDVGEGGRWARAAAEKWAKKPAIKSNI